MDNTEDFYSSNSGSIPLSRAKFITVIHWSEGHPSYDGKIHRKRTGSVGSEFDSLQL